MSSGTFDFCTKVSLLTAVACIISATPDDYLAKNPSVPSSNEDYQLPNGFLDGALYSESRPRRAPWAPSMTRSEAYLRKVMELTGRAKGKRPAKTLQGFGLQEGPALQDVVNLLGYLEQKHSRGSDDQRRSAKQERSEINKFTDPSAEVVLPEEASYGRWREVSDPKNSNGKDVLVQFLGHSREPKANKRVPGGLSIGFGHDAANAAISAFEDILREAKNYKQEHLPNPVKFLGRR